MFLILRMYRFFIFIASFVLSINLFGQSCPSLTNPINGANNVPVNTIISWDEIDGVTGYIIAIGTAPGTSDILSAQTSINSYTPPLGLPDNTQVYVTITLFFFNLPNIVCSSQSFTTEDILVPPACSSMSNPINGQTNVSVAANVSWDYIPGANGYFITIGTSPGTGDLINNLDVGNTLQYNPISDFSPLTEIYIIVVPYNENGNLSSCNEESFTTGDIAALPSCSALISPFDGETNIPLSPLIEWEATLGATGYTVFIGSSPLINDILDGGVFFTNSTFVINFEPNTLYFIRIVPFNDSGDALNCSQGTFSTILGCGPFFDPISGELITLNPQINFPDEVGICDNTTSTIITSMDEADGYRWYSINNSGVETLISSDREVVLNAIGLYRYEAYNLSEDTGAEIECSSTKEFEVVPSQSPVINGVNVNEISSGLQIIIQTSSNGNFEYAIESEQGPYQNSNIFNNAPQDTSVVYVRDKDGCGLAEFKLLGVNRFPKFFTPNADGAHDFWQYNSKNEDNFTMLSIHIYDRYGKLMKQINPNGEGWNGTMNGNKLPTSDYWYKALASNGMIFNGHFTLKR